MNENPQPKMLSTGSWIFEHLLALLTLCSFVYVYWLLTHFDLTAEIDPMQVPLGVIFAGTWSVIAAIVFWIRMYRDYFRERPATHAAAWGLFLLIGAHLAALFWFVLFWRPRHRPA